METTTLTPTPRRQTFADVLVDATRATYVRIAELEARAACRAGQGQAIPDVIGDFTEGLQRRIAELEAAEVA